MTAFLSYRASWPDATRLYVSVVGYALERRDVDVGPGGSAGDGFVTFPLAEGTATYSESVTVSAGVFREPADPIPSSQILGSAELLNLRGVLADDPLRAVQVLPGVATGDDLRSERSEMRFERV